MFIFVEIIKTNANDAVGLRNRRRNNDEQQQQQQQGIH